jgi:PBSX family phage terminase large subunit
MKLTPAQIQIASCKNRFRVVNCGRQFGKTTLAVEEIKALALYKESRIVYIARTIQQARDIAWNQLKSELQPIIKKCREAPSLEIEVGNLKGTTSLIQLRGWEAVETLRGQQFDMIVLDEVASMRNFWSNWQEVLLATLAFRKGSALFISTPKGFNHFYDLYNLEAKDKDFRSFHFTSYDNPYLDPKEIEMHKKKETEDRFSQEYLADFRKTEGLVYKEFDRSKHLYKDKIFNSVAKFAGIDFGFSNPAAVIHIDKDTDNNFYVSREWYKTNKTDEEIAEYVSGCTFNYVYPDPESPSAIESLRRKGINLREVIKGKDSIKTGINVIRELFKQGRLFIHESCENLIWELETYSYDDKKDGHNEEENPIKENDHALDALRYAMLMQAPQTNNKASVYIPNHRPIITPPIIIGQDNKPKVYYPKR